MNAATSTNHATSWLSWLQDFKRGQQYIGRYSVEKLCAFHVYQERTSVYRVIAVIVLTPLPTILTLWGLESIPLPDPRGGAKRHAITFLRSILSHTIMTYACLLCAKQAVGLTELNTKYTHKKVALISFCVAICIELWWLIWAFSWRYPVPCREFLGVTPWAIVTALVNYVFAKEELSRVWDRMRRYVPVVGTQIMIFYFLLLLPVGFAAVPWWTQITMIFVFPVIKISIKRVLWKYARNLHDLCADVTICMVEISGALYQTVCVNFVQNNLMVLLLMVLDVVQAAHETHLYVRHDYIGINSKSIVHTAISIVDSALCASGDDSLPHDENTDEHHAPGTLDSPTGVQTMTKTGTVLPPEGSFSDMIARMLKSTFWHRRRRSRANRLGKYSAETNGSETTSVKPVIRRKSSIARKNLLRKISSRAVLPAPGATGQLTMACSKSDMGTPRTNREDDSDDERLFGHRGTEIQGTTGVLIDEIFIHRKEQARILEQTLQLLFAAEVLLFVEYVEVYMPLIYSTCVALWNMPNAKYNVILISKSYDTMGREILTSLCYAALELVSFLFVYFFIKRKYGISALYQLAFLLESYAMTLQGKLIACFVIILNSSTMHQGIDLTFKFDWDALLKTPNPYKNE